MKHLLLIITMFTLSACTTFNTGSKRDNFPETREMNISIHKLVGGNPRIKAYAEITGNECKIYLRRYPQCLTHEIRHCFEGNWHEGRQTDEDC